MHEKNITPNACGILSSDDPVQVSLVIPVFNGAHTIEGVVDEIRQVFSDLRFEIILINDGSTDDSEFVCARLADEFPGEVLHLQLSRNFGEHNAALAGVRYARGRHVAMLDDDGQNSPADARRMVDLALVERLDVVYARYPKRQHSWSRILGSQFNDYIATILLKKPANLYLSSFKVINRFIADEIGRYSGPLPYLDGLILRVTHRIGQLEVEHHARRVGRSGYTLAKLIGLWLNMCVGSSIVPLRLASVAGLCSAMAGLLMLFVIGVNRIWLDPQTSLGVPCLTAAIVLAMGAQLIAIGTLGEYVGRAFLHQSGMSPFVLRYARGGENSAAGLGGARMRIQPKLPAQTG